MLPEDFRRIIRTTLRATVFVQNTLDQDVTIQVKKNRSKSVTGALDMGAAFSVAAGGNDAKTLTLETVGWLPYLFISAQCATAPTAGNLTIYLVTDVATEVAMVTALEIRDTAVHTPATDPTNMFIVEW